MDAFRRINVARDVDAFRDALQYFDVGAQNFLYGDRKGTFAYFTNAEVPIREDLQAGKLRGTLRTCCATEPAGTNGCRPEPAAAAVAAVRDRAVP